jgi:hypothetical protein
MAFQINQLADSGTVNESCLIEIEKPVGSGYQNRKATMGALATLVAGGSFQQVGSDIVRTVNGKLQEELSLDDFKGGSRTDAEALQLAIDYASLYDYGVVRIPPRLVTIDEQITVKEGVSLRGGGYAGTPEWDTNAWVYDEKGMGSVFQITFGAGGSADANAAFIMERSSSIEDCSFWYPNQSGSDASPDQYPPTIAFGIEDPADPDALADIRIERATFVNPYIGVRAVKTHGRFVMRDVNMAVWLQGIVMDKSLDVNRLENVHIHPGFMYRGDWPANHCLYWQYQQASGYGIAVGACDQPYIHSCFVFGGRQALRIAPITTGLPNGVVVNQSGFEGCFRAVQIEAKAQVVKFTGCLFGTFDLDSGAGLYGDSALVLAGTGGADLIRWVDFVNCMTFSSRKQAINCANFKNVKVSGCSFNGIHAGNEGFSAPAILFSGGNGLQYMGNSLAMNGTGNVLDYYLSIAAVSGFIIKDNLWHFQPGASSRMVIDAFSNAGRIDCNMASDASGAGITNAGANVTAEVVIPYTA